MFRAAPRIPWHLLMFSLIVFGGLAACDDIVVEPDPDVATGPDITGADSVAPPTDTDQPGPDAVTPPRDTVTPPRDTVVPPRDTVTPPRDTVVPPRDTVTPPDAVVPPDEITPPPLPCVDGLLEPAYGNALATPFTAEGDEELAGSCGGAGSKEFAYRWDVPFSDWFVLDTLGSDFDSVLYLLRDRCDGREIACNNDVGEADDASRIVARFEEGQTVLVVVDGNTGARGNAVLNVNPVTCPTADVGDGTTLPQTHSTATGPSERGGLCGGDDAPERTFRFIPPQTGLWRMSAKADITADFSPALYVEKGAMCGGLALGCNGHDNGSIGMPVEVTRLLREGDPVTLVVDSRRGTGSFELDAKRIGDTCPATPEMDIPPEGVSLDGQSDVMTSSCGQNADVEWGQFQPYADYLIAVEDLSPEDSLRCSVQVTAGFPFSLAVIGGDCSGPELSCQANSQRTPEGTYTLVYTLPHRGGRLTLVVSPVTPQWSGAWTNSLIQIGRMCVI